MRTNIVIEESLIKKAMNYKGLRTKKDVCISPSKK
jgi:hypothetical protein